MDCAEVDFALSQEERLTHLIECKLADKFPQAGAIQLVRDLRQEEYRKPVRITDAATWLGELTA